MLKRLFDSGSIRVLMPILCFAFMVAAIAAAQEGGSETTARKHSLKDGAWALQFQLGSAFSRRGYEDVILSAKHHLSDAVALKFGLGLEGSLSFGNRDYEDRFDEDRESIMIESGLIFYKSPGFGPYIFLGAGPFLSFSRYYHKSEDTRYYDGEFRRYYSISDLKTFSFGVSGVLGAEWFATEVISLTAEYGCSFEYEFRATRSEFTNLKFDQVITNKYHENTFGLDLKRVLMGLSVYF